MPIKGRILSQACRRTAVSVGRKVQCTTCNSPLPYWRRPPDDVSANWAVGTPRDCEWGCHLVVAELVTRMWSKYDMEPERPQ